MPKKPKKPTEDVDLTLAEITELTAKLEERDRECGQFREMAQRAQADLENHRKKIADEMQAVSQSATFRILTKLLPILDDLQRAFEQDSKDKATNEWINGIQLIEKNIYGLLESEGVTLIDPKGLPFDPWQHEGIISLESDEFEPGTVVEVIRKGYKLHNKVLRAAQVGIAKDPAPEET